MSNELSELMKALEAWTYRSNMSMPDDIYDAYMAYRNAPQPLVLEQVDNIPNANRIYLNLYLYEEPLLVGYEDKYYIVPETE